MTQTSDTFIASTLSALEGKAYDHSMEPDVEFIKAQLRNLSNSALDAQLSAFELLRCLEIAVTIKEKEPHEVEPLLLQFESHFGQNELTIELRRKLDEKDLARRIVSLRDYVARNPDSASFISCSDFPGDKGVFQSDHFEQGMYCLQNCSLVGAHTVSISSHGDIFLEQNDGYMNPVDSLRHIAKGQGVEDEPITVDQLITLVSPMSHCFYHWIMDCFPKAIVAESCGYQGLYLIPRETIDWAQFTLGLLGVAPERLHPLSSNTYRVRELCIPTHWAGVHINHSPKLFRRIRDILVSELLDVSASFSDRIYVARKPTCHARRVVNEKEVEEILHQYGFQKVYFEDYSPPEQIAIAKQTRILLGPHGSGMMHTLFMPEKSGVVEFFPPSYVNSVYVPMSELLDHDYFVSVSSVWEGYAHGSDIAVNLVHLRYLMRKLCGRKR